MEMIMTTSEMRKQRLEALRAEGVRIPWQLDEEQLGWEAPSVALQEQWTPWCRVWDRPEQSDQAAANWDRAQHTLELNAEIVARRTSESAAKERDQAAQEAAQRAEDADRIKAHLRARFLSLPGTTPEQFEEQYPTLLAEHHRQEMARPDDAGERARRAMRPRL
jgi:hypothetical protein